VHVDLNLLTALDALLEENSVAAAADRMHLSAPAMSRTLSRIRRATDDAILVRTGRTMTPTPRAIAMRDEVHTLVQQAETLLNPVRTLDLRSLERTFAIRAHDALTDALGALLLGALTIEAPRVSVRLLPETSGDETDLIRGHVDLEIGSGGTYPPEIAAETIGNDNIVAAFNREHPLASGEMTAERFAAARHVIVSRRGRLHDVIDEALVERGLHRHVVGSLPTSTAALGLVARSDLVTTVAEGLCRRTCEALGVRTRRIPLVLRPVLLIQRWHHRYDTDLAHIWLRTHVHRALGTMAP